MEAVVNNVYSASVFSPRENNLTEDTPFKGKTVGFCHLYPPCLTICVFCRRRYVGKWILFFTSLQPFVPFHSSLFFSSVEEMQIETAPHLGQNTSSTLANMQGMCQKRIQDASSQRLTACLSVAVNPRTNIWGTARRAGRPQLLVTESTQCWVEQSNRICFKQ